MCQSGLPIKAWPKYVVEYVAKEDMTSIVLAYKAITCIPVHVYGYG